MEKYKFINLSTILAIVFSIFYFLVLFRIVQIVGE